MEGWSLRVDGTHEAWPIVGVLGCFDGGERWRPEGGGDFANGNASVGWVASKFVSVCQ